VIFIVLVVNDPVLQVKLLVCIFVMRLIMLISIALSYGVSLVIAKVRYSAADKMNFETLLIFLVWI
jgi:K(+)-stimulated pyrophosphate-energized sodium pump